MIKKYKEFLFERFSQSDFEDNYQKIESYDVVDMYNPELKTQKEYMQNLRNEFAKKIAGLDNYFDSWFSKLASSDGDPEKDFNDMQKFIDRTGFNLDVIKKLFSKKVCQLTSEYFPYFITRNNLDIINGYIDTYLYMLNDKLNISLDTGVISDIELGGGLNEDGGWIIKYAYGYHKTPYGNLFLKSLGMSEEDFLDKTFSSAKSYFIENIVFDIKIGLRKLNIDKVVKEFDKISNDIDWGKFIYLDDDGFIVYYIEILDEIIKKCEDLNEYINEEFMKNSVISVFDNIKNIISIHDSGEYLHFYENHVTS